MQTVFSFHFENNSLRSSNDNNNELKFPIVSHIDWN